ncbi:hypothetical protein EDD17DRAFT_1465872 [Pisolithus thermaeus]|nr:hypothetical protein EDD17DRAFT_1465872 [Pisolithus thermaeus]
MDNDLRVSKPRLPKAYTDEQLVFLRSHISGFETRTRGHVRGDAKKFALERANDFLARFGLPEELQGIEDAEPRFREQIYNWYKNTVGRARRKLEGRTRPKKTASHDHASLNTRALHPASATPSIGENGLTWGPTVTTPPTVQYTAQNETTAQNAEASSQIPAAQSAGQMQFSFQSNVPVASSSTIALNVTPAALRDAFLTHGIDTATLSSLIQSYVLSHPSPTPLDTVISSLFEAISSLLSAPSSSRTVSFTDLISNIVRRFLDACSYFPSSLLHAGVSGPLAGPRALQMALRKSSVWSPLSSSSGHASLADEMERIAADRQRRKDHIQWAQIHAAALELGMLSFRPNTPEIGYAVPSSQTFSEMMARDAVWEADEVEWVAGIIVFRALIRTGSANRKVEYEQLLATYERRWKEIKDEARQALVTEVLLGAREDLAHLGETRVP